MHDNSCIGTEQKAANFGSRLLVYLGKGKCGVEFATAAGLAVLLIGLCFCFGFR